MEGIGTSDEPRYLRWACFSSDYTALQLFKAIAAGTSNTTINHLFAKKKHLIGSTILIGILGRAIAQAVSRWLPTAAARIQTRVSWPHFTLSNSRLTNMECQVPVFISPRNRMARLYPQALSSIFVTSYNSQWRYSIPPPHWRSLLSQSQNQSYFTTGGLPPTSSSWRQAPCDSRPVILFSNWTPEVIVVM
jgi:hypothetical protein